MRCGGRGGCWQQRGGGDGAGGGRDNAMSMRWANGGNGGAMLAAVNDWAAMRWCGQQRQQCNAMRQWRRGGGDGDGANEWCWAAANADGWWQSAGRAMQSSGNGVNAGGGNKCIVAIGWQ